MYIMGIIFLSALAGLGVALSVLDFIKRGRAKHTRYICLCFDEALFEGKKPDMLVICRSDAEQEEIIKRIGESESRRIYIKYL